MVRRFNKRRSEHALNSIHKSCKLQKNRFKCDGLGKVHKNSYSPICQTLFTPLTSMRCTKTISRPGMASHRKSLLTSHSVMEMCNTCFMDTKYKCLRCELPICNNCSVFEEKAGKSVAYCEAKALRALYFGISLKTRSSN